MIALVGAIFLASVVGSLHCAGMCGAFVAIACGRVGAERKSARDAAVLQCAYHGGRLLTYVTMGAFAGAAGHLLDLAGKLAGVQPVAATLAGVTMIAFALVTLMRLGGFHLATLHPPAFMSRLLGPAHRAAMRRPPATRAFMIGLFTTLLPCGWLYAFVVTAAGTASPFWGATAMAVFWAGTLPMLVMIGASARRLLGYFGEHLPAVTCLIMVAVGLYTIVSRGLLDPKAMAQTVEARHAADETAAVPSPGSPMPCCPPATDQPAKAVSQ